MGSRRHARLAPLSLRLITNPDNDMLQQLYQVEVSAYEDPWTQDDIASTFTDNTRCLGLFIKDELIGFAIISIVVDDSELYTIGISKKYQGLGFGRKLLLASLKECQKLGAVRCFLEVRVSNDVAFHLYDSYGFSIVGTRKNYYQGSGNNPPEDAYTMVCDLTKLPDEEALILEDMPLRLEPSQHIGAAF